MAYIFFFSLVQQNEWHSHKLVLFQCCSHQYQKKKNKFLLFFVYLFVFKIFWLLSKFTTEISVYFLRSIYEIACDISIVYSYVYVTLDLVRAVSTHTRPESKTFMRPLCVAANAQLKHIVHHIRYSYGSLVHFCRWRACVCVMVCCCCCCCWLSRCRFLLDYWPYAALDMCCACSPAAAAAAAAVCMDHGWQNPYIYIYVATHTHMWSAVAAVASRTQSFRCTHATQTNWIFGTSKIIISIYAHLTDTNEYIYYEYAQIVWRVCYDNFFFIFFLVLA